MLTSLFALSTYAQIPNIIPYQGQIGDTSGKAYDGSFNFQLKTLQVRNFGKVERFLFQSITAHIR